MRLTRKKAIELCIEAWTIHAKTGCTKSGLPKKHQGIISNCWLCEYDERHKKSRGGADCEYCPLVKQLGVSHCSNTYYKLWAEAKIPRTRKKYAKLFLEQIKTLRS